jgi:hypothetical protein
VDQSSINVLDGFVEEAVWAPANNITPKTSGRYRKLGLPFLYWGGKVYIDVAGARDFLLTRKPGSPRRDRSPMAVRR